MRKRTKMKMEKKRVEERKAPPVEETKKRVEKEETEKENRKMRYNVDLFYNNEHEIPNSQAPVPGREVYWNMDTPESKRFRESLLSMSGPPSPCPHPALASPALAPSPRLRLVAPRREPRPTLASLSITQGEAAMEEALRLCRAAEEDEQVQEEGKEGAEVEEAIEESGMGQE